MLILTVNDKVKYLRKYGVNENTIQKWEAISDIRNLLMHPKYSPISLKSLYSFKHFMPQIFCFLIDFTKELFTIDDKLNNGKVKLEDFTRRTEHLEKLHSEMHSPHSEPQFDELFRKRKLQLPVFYGIALNQSINSKSDK